MEMPSVGLESVAPASSAKVGIMSWKHEAWRLTAPGATLPKPTDGISIVPTLLGRGQQREHPYLYWELGAARAVRMGHFKAVRAKRDVELYDLRDDLAESTDVAAKHPDVVERVRAILDEAHTDSPFATWTYTGPMPAGASKPTKKRKSRNP